MEKRRDERGIPIKENQLGSAHMRIWIVFLVVYSVIVVLFLYVIWINSYTMIQAESKYNKECLKEIAEKYCNSEGLSYKSIYLGNSGFLCYNERTSEAKRANFFTKELNSCINEE